MLEDKQDKKNALKSYARYSSIAIQMLAIILLGVFGGIQLDKLIEWGIPVFTVSFSFISVILAIYYVTKDFLKKDKS